MKIGKFREIFNQLNWSRQDLSGSTREEFLRCNVAVRLTPNIEAVQAALLEVSPRFSADIERANAAIESAERMIVRWSEAREAKAKIKPTEPAQPSRLCFYLVPSAALARGKVIDLTRKK